MSTNNRLRSNSHWLHTSQKDHSPETEPANTDVISRRGNDLQVERKTDGKFKKFVTSKAEVVSNEQISMDFKSASNAIPQHRQTAKLETIDQLQAEKIIANCSYPRQRDLRDSHVYQISQAMINGKFISGTQIHFVIFEGKEYLIDGQHRIHALMLAGTSISFVVVRTFVSTEKEMDDLYWHIDLGKGRGSADGLKARNFGARTGLKSFESSALATAAKIINADFKYPSKAVSIDETIDGAEEWAIEAQSYFQITSLANSKMSKKLRRGAIIAVAVVTLRYCKEAAEEFWTGIALNDGLHKGDPRKTIHEFINETAITGGGTTTGKKVSIPYTCRAIARAWNAFVEERELTVIVPGNHNAPINLNGTPYRG